MITHRYSAFRAEIEARPEAEALMSVRHQAFFIGVRRNRPGQAAHCAFALARDLWWTLRHLRREGATGPAPDHAFISSLAGVSGRLALQPLKQRLRREGRLCVDYVHPRLRGTAEALLPVRPQFRKLLAALGAVMRAPRPPSGFSRLALGLLLARASLWSAVWQATFAADRLERTETIVHNDFDMFLRPATIVAQAGGRDAVCVQHGVPTAEFFPLTARRHLVWSRRIAQIYTECGGAPVGVEITSDRPILRPRAHGRRVDPVVRLVSQTHSVIYGHDAPRALVRLGVDLAAAFGARNFRVLLHPDEAGGERAWRGRVPGAVLERAPHQAFAPSSDELRIFVGFSSTALIEAAANGHLVISADLAHADSFAARALLRTPMMAAPEEVADLVRRLAADPALCEAGLDAQERWLADVMGFQSGQASLPDGSEAAGGGLVHD